MRVGFSKSRITLAVTAALGAAAIGVVPSIATAAKTAGTYVSGDFHNHTTCSDGSISMQKLVKKATDKTDTPWGLDWFVQAGHGGNGNRNCTLAEDETLATPAYPLVTSPTLAILGPTTTWQNSRPPVQPKGLGSGFSPSQNMWRWQSIQEFQYPIVEYLSRLKNVPLFVGIETVVPGHEHTSMSVVTGQMPMSIDTGPALPTTSGYTPLGNANALAYWEYCFDRSDTDTGRGNVTVGSVTVEGGNNWNCKTPGALNFADPSWNVVAQKLVIAGGTGSGTRGHQKTLAGLSWMQAFHRTASYYVPAHLERAGPFNPDGNNGFNIEHLRNFNNTAPMSGFGFESQPGHGASDTRGEYTIRRNGISGVNVDTVGGTTYGGTGVYAGQIGGVWDALLGEGRNWWFFASSDWHNRGSFGPDDRRTTQDFYPGEYQREYVMVRNGSDPKLRPQMIVDGLRTGNAFSTSGQLIDRLAFVACVANATNTPASVQALAIAAAQSNRDTDVAGCNAMGEKLVVATGADVIVSIVVRDPPGTNYSPYSFSNPSLAQVNIQQPINAPVLDHVDVIRGMVSGYRTPGASDYSGQWPSNWINAYIDGGSPTLASVPAGAKNTSAALLRTFNASTWTPVAGTPDFKAMTFVIGGVTATQYLRLRGSNLPPSVPWETDANGNPLPDLWTNAAAVNPTVNGGSDGRPANFYLRIPCTVTGTSVPPNGTTFTGGTIDGCPNHLPAVGGVKFVTYDVAAWSDLWFYSNPIYIEVNGSTLVAGVK